MYFLMHAPLSGLKALKGEDDGSVFTTFLKESRFPPQMKTVTWENVKEILDTFNVRPICYDIFT